MTAAFSPARRAFLRGRTEAPPPLRPPWAIAETAFHGACTRCNDCIGACPETVLVAGDGGYPAFDPARGECLFCGACADACETGAIGDTGTAPWTIKAAIAATCLVHGGVTCFRCRDMCGEAAIGIRPALGGAQIALDAARCTGCGACVGVCPVSAIALSAAKPVDA